MAKNSNETKVSKKSLDNLKNEVASELGVNLKNSEITSKEAGKVGGEMVKRMISKYENQ